jgi:hypothetical protein
MSDGQLKPDKDYTSEVDKAIPEAQNIAKVSKSLRMYDLADVSCFTVEWRASSGRQTSPAREANTASFRPSLNISTSGGDCDDSKRCW